jgi:hypothetical protein
MSFRTRTPGVLGGIWVGGRAGPISVRSMSHRRQRLGNAREAHSEKDRVRRRCLASSREERRRTADLEVGGTFKSVARALKDAPGHHPCDPCWPKGPANSSSAQSWDTDRGPTARIRRRVRQAQVGGSRSQYSASCIRSNGHAGEKGNGSYAGFEGRCMTTSSPPSGWLRATTEPP